MRVPIILSFQAFNRNRTRTKRSIRGLILCSNRQVTYTRYSKMNNANRISIIYANILYIDRVLRKYGLFLYLIFRLIRFRTCFLLRLYQGVARVHRRIVSRAFLTWMLSAWYFGLFRNKNLWLFGFFRGHLCFVCRGFGMLFSIGGLTGMVVCPWGLIHFWGGDMRLCIFWESCTSDL